MYTYLEDTLSPAPQKVRRTDFEVKTIKHFSSSSLDKLSMQNSYQWGLGCLTKLPAVLHEYFPYRDDLTVDDGIVMKGLKDVISRL